MTYLEKVVDNLTKQVQIKLKLDFISQVEAEHVSGLLIQTIICHGDEFSVDIKYLRMALNAIRRENGVYTELDAHD